MVTFFYFLESRKLFLEDFVNNATDLDIDETGKPRSLHLLGEPGPNMETSSVIGCLGHRIGRHV